MGKILVVEFDEGEEALFQQIVKWLSNKLSHVPTIITEQKYNFSIDQFTRTFINSKGQKIYLTAKEFDLFYLLVTHKNQVFSKEQLYENVWGYLHTYDAKNLTSSIRKLRKKIEVDPSNPKYIITVWGIGYKFTDNP